MIESLSKRKGRFPLTNIDLNLLGKREGVWSNTCVGLLVIIGPKYNFETSVDFG